MLGKIVMGGCILAMACLAQSKPGGMPATPDLQREMQRVERERQAMFGADKLVMPHAPHLFPNVPAPPRAEIDLERLARHYAHQTTAWKTDALMIFASFTMPPASLKRLIRQAHQVGAAVILRGFKDRSLKATVQAIHRLGEAGGQVLINPEAFAQYAIDAVPTIVLTQANVIDPAHDPARAFPKDFVAVSGDVSLDYALEEIARRAPPFAPTATRYLRQLRGASR